MRRRSILAITFALLAASRLFGANPATLDGELRRTAKSANGEVGVAAWSLEGGGPRVLLNGDQPFPMASTFKVAIAGAVLARIDAGELSLDKMLPVEPDKYVESDVIASALIHPGVSLSIENLLELMLTRSDNTATDVLVTAAGGPEAVTGWVRKLGISGLRVDRDTAGILRDFFHFPMGTFSEALAAARKSDPKLDERGEHPNPTFDNDPRDTSTPSAMAELLTKIFSGRALSPPSTKTIIATMERCHTGDNRIRARLPSGTVVADKTGTLGGTVNDVGVITLPENKRRLVLALFIKKSDLPFAAREKVIADLARAIYDYFLFTDSK